jgi:dihydrofolate synthase / folylpolyglutamate synthase
MRAADWFKACGCAHTIWEAGIGGRLDPVRLIEARRLALTALDLEHTELLGDTLEEIACDKADAAPPGAVIYTPAFGPGLDTAIESHCARRGVAVERIAAGEVHAAPLPGAHQAANAAFAVRLARDMAALEDEDVRLGLAATRWPGRLELIERDPDVIIDVGHTPRGVEAALAGFEALRRQRPGVLVCGVSRDKDVGAIVAALAPSFPLIICVAAAHKGAPASAVAEHARRAHPKGEIFATESVAAARILARSRAAAMGGVVYVAGGLFSAAEFKAAAKGIPPDSLCFL